MSTPVSHAAAGEAALQRLVPPVRGLILDVDGVLWRDSQPIGDLPRAFRLMRSRGLELAIATNNAMRTVEEYRLKLAGFGVEFEAGRIVTSAEATADTLASRLPAGGNVFVVGEHGVIEALTNRGFRVTTDPHVDAQYAAVVAGIDRSLSYLKIQKAANLVRAGTPFYGTNADATFPTEEGLVPGAGAILASIASAAGKEPTVVGKPSPLLFEIASQRMGLQPADLLVIGDRLETDVAGGQAFGARTALVLSGVSTLEQAQAWRPPPTLVAQDLTSLFGS